jgi:hypothetical protein
MFHINTALQTYVRAMLGVRRARFVRARESGDLGASAVELAIITAMILGVAVALLYVIKNFVHTESSQIHG